MFNVLLVGDACEDIYHYGYCERLSPEAPVPVLKHNYSERRDGMCLNVRNNLIAFNIAVKSLTNKRMIKKERFVDLKTKQHLLRTDFGENLQLTPCTKLELEKINFDYLDAVVISDYNKGFIDNETVEYILSKTKDINVFVDSKKNDLSIFENCIIKINQAEYSKVNKYPKKYELIITSGEKGAIWNDKIFPTERCDVFDVCGAGDTFMAALVSEYLKTKSFDKSIEFANKCSRIVVQKFGTYTLKSEDIDDLRI
jgi:D-beta-D-heptose 7-phosphate kinase/D-beta-D-heptose 1-phosphate adenosyltransferase